MKSMIICEGSTDFALLQYYMRKAYRWDDSNVKLLEGSPKFERVRTLKKNTDTVTIGGVGGCGKIIPCFEFLLDNNRIAALQEEVFDNIVIITDRDEWETEETIKKQLTECLQKYSIETEELIGHNRWLRCCCKNGRQQEITFSVLLLVVPFETTGAMETFLLEAVAKNNAYDAGMIEKCNRFVDEVDPEKRYLNKRRYITKAKYDVYFSVRTSAGEFIERQNILKNVEWEKYTEIQKSFQKLGELSADM